MTKKERVYIRVTETQKEKLKEMALKENRSLSNYILTVVESHINKEENKMKFSKYEIVYKDELGEIVVGEFSGNQSLTIDRALEAAGVDMDEFAEENDWDGWDWNCLEIRVKRKEETKMKNEWLEETMKNLKVGDLVAKNFGSFKQSMAYVVTEITDDKVICRLLRNDYSIDKLKMNKNYCSRDLIFELDKMGSFPSILKLNTGYRDTDEVRQKNLENVWMNKEEAKMRKFRVEITRNKQSWTEEIQAENGDSACYKALEPYAKKMGGKVVHGIQGIGVESPVIGSWPTQYKISYWATCLK